MVADHHKSRAMLILRQCERCTRREYSPASTRGDLRASTRGEYSRQCEIALRRVQYMVTNVLQDQQYMV